jgi:hypothetical protein
MNSNLINLRKKQKDNSLIKTLIYNTIRFRIKVRIAISRITLSPNTNDWLKYHQIVFIFKNQNQDFYI